MRALVIALVAACGAPRSPAPPNPAVSSVPFDNAFGLIFLEVSVANAAPRSFLLDSGADQTILDLAAARELASPSPTKRPRASPAARSRSRMPTT